MTKVFDTAGNEITVSDDVPVNDLARAPILSGITGDVLYVPVVIPSKTSKPRLALIEPSVLATAAQVSNVVTRVAAMENGPAAEFPAVKALVQQLDQRVEEMETGPAAEFPVFVQQVEQMEATEQADIADLKQNKADKIHTHAFTDITAKPSTYPPSTHSHAYADITGKPSTFAPSAHVHVISDVTGLQSALDAKPVYRVVELSATTDASGIASFTFSPTFTRVDSVIVKETWSGLQKVTGAEVAGQRSTSGTKVQGMQSKVTLSLTAGAFEVATSGKTIAISVLGI